MKKQSLSIVIATVLGLALVPGAFAQPVNGDQNDNSMLYQPNVDLTSLSQNQFSGIVGGQIITPYYYNVSVNYLGYADPTGAALTTNHTITIWGASGWPGGGNYATPGAVVASATVPAGTPSLWANGYAWVKISTVTLDFQSVYNVGATVVAGQDNWGNFLANTDTVSSPDPYNNGQITWNVSPNGTGPANSGPTYGPFIQADNGSQYTAYNQAIYDFNTSDAGNPNPTINISGNDSIYSAVNLGYNIIVAPVTLSITKSGSNVILSWPNGTLQQSTNVGGTYSDIIGATSPYTNSISGTQNFFRVKVQ